MNTATTAASQSPTALKKVQHLYNKHWDDLCKFVHSRFGSGPPDPEDVAQNAFIKYADAHESKSIDNPKAFLFRTASNLVVDHHRSPKNVQPTEDDINSFENTEKSDVWSPETVLMGKQEADIVQEVLMTLPERDRAFVLMNRLENKTYTEIAKEANMSRSGVQKIIMQALEKCMTALQQATHD